jgi:hypothetical protein
MKSYLSCIEITHLLPCKTSGLQYSIVPQNVPNWAEPSNNAADPKSMSFTWKSSSTMMFSSLISRWTMLWEWRYERADTNWNSKKTHKKTLKLVVFTTHSDVQSEMLKLAPENRTYCLQHYLLFYTRLYVNGPVELDFCLFCIIYLLFWWISRKTSSFKIQ